MSIVIRKKSDHSLGMENTVNAKATASIGEFYVDRRNNLPSVAESELVQKKDHYCVILAGGKGRRLWPLSKIDKPKQFVDLFGVGRTSLQQTFDRFSKFLPAENIIVSTLADFVPIVREQLPELPEGNIIAEPIVRGTAPALMLAADNICRRNADAAIIATPADLMILNEDIFVENMQDALTFVGKEKKLLTIGVKPTRPERGYGYIQTDVESPQPNVFKVKSFTEKPNIEFAQMFMDSGEFYWNTGMLVVRADTFLTEIKKALPELQYEDYTQYPNASVDTSVLEKSDNVYIMTCNFGWADLGTWHNIYEQLPKTKDGNVLMDSAVIVEDSHGNIVHTGKRKLTILRGIEDCIVVDHDDVLLICKRGNSSAAIKKYRNEARIYQQELKK